MADTNFLTGNMCTGTWHTALTSINISSMNERFCCWHWNAFSDVQETFNYKNYPKLEDTTNGLLVMQVPTLETHALDYHCFNDTIYHSHKKLPLNSHNVPLLPSLAPNLAGV